MQVLKPYCSFNNSGRPLPCNILANGTTNQTNISNTIDKDVPIYPVYMIRPLTHRDRDCDSALRAKLQMSNSLLRLWETSYATY